MPYQHSKHAPVLRKALLGLKGSKMGALFLLKELSRTWKPANPDDRMSRQALEEFTAGRESKKVVALSALWEFLQKHETYRAYFPAENKVEDDLNALIMGAVFARTCRLPQDYPWPPAQDDARFGLAGSFVMFCPPWKPIAGGNVLHVMEFKTQMVHGSFIADILHKQPDGSLVTYSCVLQEWEVMGTKAVCFAGRQVAIVDGNPVLTCLAVTVTLTPDSEGELLLSRFKGGLLATDQPERFPFIHFFPAIAFYCRRPNHRMGDGAALERGELTEIRDDDPDREALIALLHP